MTALPSPTAEHTPQITAPRPILRVVAAAGERDPREAVPGLVAVERSHLEAAQAAILLGGPAVAAVYWDEQSAIRW